VVLAFFALAKAGEQNLKASEQNLKAGEQNSKADEIIVSDYQKSLPNCDVPIIFDFAFHRNENGTLNIVFDIVDDKPGIGNQYLIRHSRSNYSAEIVSVNEKQDFIYFANLLTLDFQICEVTNNFTVPENFWDKASPVTFEMGNAEKTYSNLDYLGGSASNSDSKMFKARCDLVQAFQFNVSKNFETNTLTVTVTWTKKQSSYKSIGQFDNYVLRYGRQNNVGDPIPKENVWYTDFSHEETFTLVAIPRGTLYGFQICAENLDWDENRIDWQKEAWLGSIDLTNYSNP